jgi:hypothetical protein
MWDIFCERKGEIQSFCIDLKKSDILKKNQRFVFKRMHGAKIFCDLFMVEHIYTLKKTRITCFQDGNLLSYINSIELKLYRPNIWKLTEKKYFQ